MLKIMLILWIIIMHVQSEIIITCASFRLTELFFMACVYDLSQKIIDPILKLQYAVFYVAL